LRNTSSRVSHMWASRSAWGGCSARNLPPLIKPICTLPEDSGDYEWASREERTVFKAWKQAQVHSCTVQSFLFLNCHCFYQWVAWWIKVLQIFLPFSMLSLSISTYKFLLNFFTTTWLCKSFKLESSYRSSSACP
jgi:hypothetical protein